jgi:kynurenine formamidase
MILLGQGILIMEHVAYLETLPASRFQVVGVPLRIRGGTGSPIRAIAVYEGEGVRA